MSLFKRDAKPQEPKPKPTIFGAMQARGSAQAKADESVLVEKGKSFALFRKPAKPLEPVAEMTSVHEATDGANVLQDTPVIDVPFTESEPVAAHATAEAEKGGWLSRKKPTASTSVPEAKAKGSGLFSRSNKSAVTEATGDEPVSAKPSKASEKKPKRDKKEAKAKTKSGFSSRAASEVFIHTELNEGTVLWWKLTAGSLERVESEQVSRALSFSTNDTRYVSRKKLAFAQANNLALSESSEYCSLVNATGGPFGAVHATPRERALSAEWRIAPGMLALDRLFESKLQGREPTDDIKASDAIVGFNLEDAANGNSLVILFKLSGDHVLSNLQISVNAEDLGFVLNQFAQAARINSEDAPVILFSAEELLAVAGGVDAFPHEAVWQGYSVRKILTGALAVSAAAAVVAGGLSGTAFVQQLSLKKQRVQLEAVVKQKDTQAAELVNSSIRSFAQKTSLDHQEIFKAAQALWMPGATVVMTADYGASNTRYELRMPIPQGTPIANKPSVAFALTPENLSRLVDYKAAEGCVREGTYIAGSLNEVQIIVNCQVPASALSRYRLE